MTTYIPFPEEDLWIMKAIQDRLMVDFRRVRPRGMGIELEMGSDWFSDLVLGLAQDISWMTAPKRGKRKVIRVLFEGREKGTLAGMANLLGVDFRYVNEYGSPELGEDFHTLEVLTGDGEFSKMLNIMRNRKR